MQMTRNSNETMAGPGEWFTGAVYIDAVATPSGQSQLRQAASTSRRAPGPRGTPIRTGRPST